METRKDGAVAVPSELAITYVFDAPRELVFESWLEPEHLKAWFAPGECSVTRCEVDARAGGKWRVEYRSAEGEAHAEYGEFRELLAPERLVFTLTQASARGQVGEETTVQVMFVARGKKTEIQFLQTGFRSSQRRDANAAGWSDCFRKLARWFGTSGSSA